MFPISVKHSSMPKAHETDYDAATMLQHFFLFLYDLYSDPVRWARSIQDAGTSGHASLKNSPTLS